jgi:hypothetical protein
VKLFQQFLAFSKHSGSVSCLDRVPENLLEAFKSFSPSFSLPSIMMHNREQGSMLSSIALHRYVHLPCSAKHIEENTYIPQLSL